MKQIVCVFVKDRSIRIAPARVYRDCHIVNIVTAEKVSGNGIVGCSVSSPGFERPVGQIIFKNYNPYRHACVELESGEQLRNGVTKLLKPHDNIAHRGLRCVSHNEKVL